MSYLACVFASCKQMKVHTIVTSKQLLSWYIPTCFFLFCSHPLVVHLYQLFFLLPPPSSREDWSQTKSLLVAAMEDLISPISWSSPCTFRCWLFFHLLLPSFLSPVLHMYPSLFSLSPPSFTNYKPTETGDRSHLQLKNVQTQAIHSFCNFINAHRVCKLVACTQ